MEILSPLPAASLVYEAAPGRHALAVVCKATIALEPVASTLAAVQEPIQEREQHWDDDPKRSLYLPSDLAPFKPRADVVLVGSAHARNDVPVRSVVARLVFAGIDKAVEVFGPRVRTRDGDLREGKRWTKMPLSWERAAGGPGTDNPVGMRPDGPRDLYGQVPLPNLQAPGSSGLPEPIGFGPIAASWRPRRSLLPRADHDALHAPFGEGFDPAFFQVAPRDQQIDAIPPGERLVLENLHPKHPRLVTDLPDLLPRALVEIDGAPAREIVLAADTLWIDTHRALCTITFRGRVDVGGPEPEGRVVIAAGKSDQPPSWPALPPRRPPPPASRPASEDVPVPREMTASDLDSWDVTQTETPPGVAEEEMRATAQGLPAPLHEPALPFQPPPPGWQPPASISLGPSPSPLYDPRLTRVSTQKLDMTGFRAGLPAWLDPAPPSLPVPPPPPPPGLLRSPVPQVVSFGAPPPPPSRPTLPLPNVEPPAPPSPPGLLEASNAAAERPSARPPDAAPSKPAAAEIVELIWFDPSLLARLRRDPVLAPLLRPDPPKAEGAGDDLARAQVHDALARTAPRGGFELEDALEAAAEQSPPGAPLAVVSGDLELCFDEAESLRAVVAAASPLAAADKKLKDAIDLAVSMLDAPLRGAPEVAEALAARVREAWTKANRIFPPGYVTAAAERALLEQRRYQVRELLDDAWIRALLAGAAPRAPIPVYLPAAIGKRLPLFKRFPARLLVEVLSQQDQAEAHPLALRALALGRVRARRGAREGW